VRGDAAAGAEAKLGCIPTEEFAKLAPRIFEDNREWLHRLAQ
jgi:hypothetical protein